MCYQLFHSGHHSPEVLMRTEKCESAKNSEKKREVATTRSESTVISYIVSTYTYPFLSDHSMVVHQQRSNHYIMRIGLNNSSFGNQDDGNHY